jgi:hypothetical protein
LVEFVELVGFFSRRLPQSVCVFLCVSVAKHALFIVVVVSVAVVVVEKIIGRGFSRIHADKKRSVLLVEFVELVGFSAVG